MNITDVGHLTSDADEGEDKLEKGAAREGLSVWDVARKYEKEFFETLYALNVLKPTIVARATEHIVDQVELIKKLESKGFIYQTSQAVYFDVSKFPNYGNLAGQNLEDKKTGVREDVVVDLEKKNPYDFAVWFKAVGRFSNHIMRWESPWGEGFPGWHIECSAMSMRYLGETVDIHTGGIDHLGVHHPAEIAQSEAATDRIFVNYWVHRAFITVDGHKMSKSLGNFYTLEDIITRGYDPISLRYLFMTAHYRTPMNFTWEALDGARSAFRKLLEFVSGPGEEPKIGCAEYEQRFLDAINEDLDMPKALSVVWELVKSDYPVSAKKASLFKFDEVLGLGLREESLKEKEIPEEIKKMAEAREEARRQGDFAASDIIRDKINSAGYSIEDTKEGPVIKKKL
jgi:cysteinyl-tRNA synthetase